MTTRQRYRSEELGISSEESGVKETQNYTYDENGNLVYVNTERLREDGKQTEKIKERKLRWDEENRLMAIDDNGFISNYWYDYAGERVVKEAGGNEGVFVNSVFSGGRTDNSTFTLYVSPYIVVSQGGHYTKHYYIGGERVVSKLGDLDSYGADPRRIEYAGEDVDKVSVDYVLKYKDTQQTVKDNYKDFKVPYLGLDNDDYVNGEGFCCTDKSSKMTALDSNIGNGNDDPEKLIFFYHSDHLGSTSYVTNLDGEVVQHVEYIPFGEVFLEERNNVWNTPYLFNSKELDEETGLYYYGARYYNPRESVWLSVDPLAEKYAGVSPYAYALLNPVRFVDPLGMAPTSPIYGTDGTLLGTDNQGLQGRPIVMNKENFRQGMSHDEAVSYSTYILGESKYYGFDNKAAINKYMSTQVNLKNRPDYDGFVTIQEGIDWAKAHPNALKNPTPENTLFIATSKLDFGNITTAAFEQENVSTPQNLFNDTNTAASITNSKLRATVYALGRVNMILENKANGTVSIVNDDATDYDWNLGGGLKRDSFIRAERLRAGLNDSHGFKAVYYGTGKLKE